jgi:sterol desaturase/sphingolipid hydroxylase (fatty acid hydroxylase superfamily)
VLSYEWLHLAYHLPPDGRIGRLRAVAVLRRHHATHHATHLMNRWNFNVTVPLWDWVRGTIHHDVPAPAQPVAGRVS